jgi:hypothetical protein
MLGILTSLPWLGTSNKNKEEGAVSDKQPITCRLLKYINTSIGRKMKVHN